MQVPLFSQFTRDQKVILSALSATELDLNAVLIKSGQSGFYTMSDLTHERRESGPGFKLCSGLIETDCDTV